MEKRSILVDKKKKTVNIQNLYCLPLQQNHSRRGTFIRILLLGRYVSVPHRTLLWENSGAVQNVLVSSSMCRNHFGEFFFNLHAADINIFPKNYNLGKLRYMIDDPNKNFFRYSPFENNVSIDEAMIPYGRHTCEQYIKNKLVKYDCGTKAGLLSSRQEQRLR